MTLRIYAKIKSSRIEGVLQYFAQMFLKMRVVKCSMSCYGQKVKTLKVNINVYDTVNQVKLIYVKASCLYCILPNFLSPKKCVFPLT